MALALTVTTTDTVQLALADGGTVACVPMPFSGGGPGTGTLIFASIAALEAYNVVTNATQAGQLAVVYIPGVSTFTSVWTYTLAGAAATVDNITVASATGAANGRWQRGPSLAIPQAFAQTTWNVNPATGSDTADGVVAPLKTMAEFQRRLGTRDPDFGAVAVALNILGTPDPVTDPWPFRTVTADVFGGGGLTVTGTLVSQAVVTLTSFTAINQAAGTKAAIGTAQATGFWTPFIGKALCQDTTTACWFEVNADAGSGAATITQPIQPTNGGAFVTPLVGDSVTVWLPPTIHFGEGKATQTSGALVFNFLNIQGLAIGLTCPGTALFQNCTFTAVIAFQPIVQLTTFWNCSFDGSCTVIGCFQFRGGQALTGSSIQVAGTPANQQGELSWNAYFDGTVSIAGNAFIQAAGFFGTIANLQQTPNVVVFSPLNSINSAQWGTASWNITSGTQAAVLHGVTAGSVFLLTGGYTIDGASTATSYHPATRLFIAPVSVTGANVDANDNNLQNPVTGSRMYVRAA